MAAKIILVVDDNADMRYLVGSWLRSAGFEVIEADGGVPAFRIIQEEALAVVVSDVQMDDLDGMQLLDLTKKLRPDLPVFLMTAGRLPEAEARRHGAQDLWHKPLDGGRLVDAVRRAAQHQ